MQRGFFTLSTNGTGNNSLQSQDINPQSDHQNQPNYFSIGGEGVYQDRYQNYSLVIENPTIKGIFTSCGDKVAQIPGGPPCEESQSYDHPDNALGMLRLEDQVLYIREPCTVIGRNSSTSLVHFHVEGSSFVSRRHFKLLFNEHSLDFHLICLSKNGVFIDSMFQRRSAEGTKLPLNGCTFRFPNTDIRIVFENFAYKRQSVSTSDDANFKTDRSPNVIPSLDVTIPETEPKSPCPSPTGTIRATNGHTTSPRRHQEYHPRPPSASSKIDLEKPPYSYAQLIVQSISAAPDKQLTLSGIYSFISNHYPYYRKEYSKGWQNSIRHNLSLSRYFIKTARSTDDPGKGSFWRIDPNSEANLIAHSYKKRRQRGSQCSRPPYMPQSAPVSPNHTDDSHDKWPSQEIVLKSESGSPGGRGPYQSSEVESHAYNYSNAPQAIKAYPTIFGSSS